MGKMKVYELAKEMGITNAELIKRLSNMGVEVKSHLSVIEDEVVGKIKKGVSKTVEKKPVAEKSQMHIIRRNVKVINTDGEKRPISMQIFGNEPETMGIAAKQVSEIADIVDINMGCPAPKVVKNGDGSRLLLNLELAKQIIETAVANSKVPVTVKMRTGWDADNIVVVEAAKIAEKAGASAITVHGRTRSQYYSGEADWNIIKQVKERISLC